MPRLQIEAKARELFEHLMRDTGTDAAHVAPAMVERIVQAVATDLQEDADMASSINSGHCSSRQTATASSAIPAYIGRRPV